jgi:hypothetical protein
LYEFHYGDLNHPRLILRQVQMPAAASAGSSGRETHDEFGPVPFGGRRHHSHPRLAAQGDCVVSGQALPHARFAAPARLRDRPS